MKKIFLVVWKLLDCVPPRFLPFLLGFNIFFFIELFLTTLLIFSNLRWKPWTKIGALTLSFSVFMALLCFFGNLLHAKMKQYPLGRFGKSALAVFNLLDRVPRKFMNICYFFLMISELALLFLAILMVNHFKINHWAKEMIAIGCFSFILGYTIFFSELVEAKKFRLAKGKAKPSG